MAARGRHGIRRVETGCVTRLEDDRADPSPTSATTDRDGLLLCARCLVWKPRSAFHNSRTGQFSYCRDCRNAYDRSYYAAGGKAARGIRQQRFKNDARRWMAELKSGIPCADCGQTYPVYVMHWDHLPGYDKIDDVSAMVDSRSRAAVLDELQKCELVCGNCHVLRTVQRMTGARRTKN